MAILGKLVERMFLGPARRMRASQFEVLPRPHHRVVFIGDSITAGANWQEWFPDTPLVNRGIDGDTTAGVLTCLDTAIDSPLAVFLLIGTNDLALGVTTDETARNLDVIAARILHDTPGVALFIQSVMPRARKYRNRIRELNRAYQSIAEQRGATYLDLWPALASPDRQIRAEFSLDKLHLNGPGYQAWTAVLRPHVDGVRETRPGLPGLPGVTR